MNVSRVTVEKSRYRDKFSLLVIEYDSIFQRERRC